MHRQRKTARNDKYKQNLRDHRDAQHHPNGYFNAHGNLYFSFLRWITTRLVGVCRSDSGSRCELLLYFLSHFPPSSSSSSIVHELQRLALRWFFPLNLELGWHCNTFASHLRCRGSPLIPRFLINHPCKYGKGGKTTFHCHVTVGSLSMFKLNGNKFPCSWNGEWMINIFPFLRKIIVDTYCDPTTNLAPVPGRLAVCRVD